MTAQAPPARLMTRLTATVVLAGILIAGGALSATEGRKVLRFSHRGFVSDIGRQVVVSEYAWRGVNPYEVSLRVHEASDVPSNPSPHQIIRRDIRAAEYGVIEELGEPPAAGYPPFCLALFAFTLRLLPPTWVDPFWLAVNVALILLTPVLVIRVFQPILPPTLACYAWMLALTLLWPATHTLLRTGQFGLFVLCGVMVALLLMSTRPVTSGVVFALAMIKPSIALPFLFVPLCRGRWLVVGVAAALHLGGLLLIAWWLREAPWVLIGQWLEVGSLYMRYGMYSLKEVMAFVDLLNTPWDAAITAAFLSLACAWTYIHRHADDRAMLAFLSCVSVLWMYHGRYDFVVLILPVVYAAAIALRPAPPPSESPLSVATRVVPLAAALFVAIALTETVYEGEPAWARVLRWLGRLSLLVMLLWSALQVRLAALEVSRRRNHAPSEHQVRY